MKTSKTKSFYLILLCWLVYTSSYIGKLSYNANINPIGIHYSVSYADVGMVSTFFFFAYGIGQVVNGFLCKKYNPKYVIFTCLLVSGTVNMALPLINDFAIVKYVWLINGAAMSFLWTLLIRLLSENLSLRDIPKAVFAMGTTVATGTFLVYGMSSLFVGIASFRLTFYVAAAILIAVSIVWLVFYNRLTSIEKDDELCEVLKTDNIENKGNKIVSFKLFIIIISFFAVANNFIKDGLTAWTPDILTKIYNTPSWLSILLTLLLPLLAIFGVAVAIKIQNITRNFVGTSTLLFLASSFLIGGVVLLLALPLLPITVGCFSVVSCLMASVNNVITSMIPLNLKGYMDSSKMAGIFNGFCYLGSTISSYTLGAVADHFDWIGVFYLLLAVSVFVVIVGTGYLIYEKRHTKTR